ncbi:SulP family inorganic anion transporter [Sphingorhabdus sp.]|jgi:SulP family sulfate permease|uniref:SulP family inorganic anion transporter n=1 Tax=Sphingorhabdus sp. TaxID=1902408 RepID=UPI0035B07EFC|nr:SulP family inorganic anion transporter [Sphingomonadaceae bacterium]
MRQPKILTTIRDYSWSLFRQDALAGLTVALVALPLSIAIAIASGATPAQGLITAIIGGFVISLTSGSRVQIGGPTGAFIVVVYSVIADHGYDGLVLATLMAGAILLVAGYLRAGRLIALVPEPVINGFTVGIAIIIATSQLKDFLGLEIAKLPAEFLPKLAALAGALPHSSPYAVGVALLALLLMVVLRRRAPRSPSLVIGVAAGSAFAAFAALPVDTIASRFGELPAGLPSPTLPSISLAKVQELLPSALVIAFLAGVESLLSAIVADRMIEGQHRPNAEIMAQGYGNIASALFGGMPVTGAIARTATNVRAGGKTPVAGMVHALLILAIMLVAARWAGMLALPALAAVLMLTAWNMSEPEKWRDYVHLPLAERGLFVLTLILTVVSDLAVAISIGVIAGLALRLLEKGRDDSGWTPRNR